MKPEFIGMRLQLKFLNSLIFIKKYFQKLVKTYAIACFCVGSKFEEVTHESSKESTRLTGISCDELCSAKRDV